MRWFPALLAAILLALAGCGSQTSPASDGPAPAGTGKAVNYDFTGTTLDGEPFDGPTLKGKPAVVWFWAPWCSTCRAQIPTVTELAEKYDGEVAVVAVGGMDSKGAIEEVAAQIPHVTHLVDAEGAVWKHFRVIEQSTYLVADADGEIVDEGYLDDHELVELVDRLAG